MVSVTTPTRAPAGRAPRSTGLAVILGHTQIGGGYGVFNHLADLRPMGQGGGSVLLMPVVTVWTR